MQRMIASIVESSTTDWWDACLDRSSIAAFGSSRARTRTLTVVSVHTPHV
jgi:hypothetical protein